MTAAAAAPLRIVAIGASNTQGWYVGKLNREYRSCICAGRQADPKHVRQVSSGRQKPSRITLFDRA
jgi:hypothetical protein